MTFAFICSIPILHISIPLLCCFATEIDRRQISRNSITCVLSIQFQFIIRRQALKPDQQSSESVVKSKILKKCQSFFLKGVRHRLAAERRPPLQTPDPVLGFGDDETILATDHCTPEKKLFRVLKL